MYYNIKKYKFLLSQLVSRDFKTKYKRSFLGILWSLLNPLLTMTVQYIVFSNLFITEIDHYIAYLLCGIVLFNFMTESTNQAMISITGNASLINKVYVPKYIFPLSKVLSSGVNLFFALLALYIMVLMSGLKITFAHLLVPLGLLFLFMFTLGLSLLLAALMVFFRDVQFLYSIFVTLWMYLTPLFYPETIIPQKFMLFWKLNPMYHFIRYLRAIVLEGVVPNLQAHIFCLVFSVGMFLIGFLVFKKTENKFIMYI